MMVLFDRLAIHLYGIIITNSHNGFWLHLVFRVGKYKLFLLGLR